VPELPRVYHEVVLCDIDIGGHELELCRLQPAVQESACRVLIW